MKTLFDLLQEKNNLPSGNIYSKKIKNKIYFYHQYREGNLNISNLLTADEVAVLKPQIERRKHIECSIKAILKSGNRELELSNYAREYTGYVMSGDKVVAEFDKGILISEPDELCPLIIKRTKILTEFLKTRSIDSGRTNSRLLRKILNINVKDDTLVSLCSYAASITDNYWFKPKHSKLKYKDISFDNDMLFDTALRGLITIYPKKVILSPELTTNGSYEKGWRNIDGEWWLYKVGTIEERYSEMFYSMLMEKLNLPTAHYELEDTFIKTKNFVIKDNFEPMISLVGENENLEYIYSVLNDINHGIALDFLRLSTFDVVLNNVDRHNENCGVMRDRITGEITCLAPNYDDNISLISRNKNLVIGKNEGFLNVFIKTINASSVLKEALSEIDFPNINEEMLLEIHKKINLPISIDFKKIQDFILFRYKTILKIVNK